MKTIRVAEYKYTGKPLNWAISAWTGLFNPGTPRYSHTEIWIPDENGLFGGYDGHLHGGYEGQYFGECFTSTMRGDWNGTVIRPASEVLTHSRRWDYFELEVEDVDYKEAVHLARVAAQTTMDTIVLGWCRSSFLYGLGVAQRTYAQRWHLTSYDGVAYSPKTRCHLRGDWLRG